jgi:hypothetical protein
MLHFAAPRARQSSSTKARMTASTFQSGYRHTRSASFSSPELRVISQKLGQSAAAGKTPFEKAINRSHPPRTTKRFSRLARQGNCITASSDGTAAPKLAVVIVSGQQAFTAIVAEQHRLRNFLARAAAVPSTAWSRPTKQQTFISLTVRTSTDQIRRGASYQPARKQP